MPRRQPEPLQAEAWQAEACSWQERGHARALARYSIAAVLGTGFNPPLLTNSRTCKLCGSDQSVSLAAAGSSHPFHSAVAAERPATIAPAEQPTYSAPAATRLRISLSSPGWPKAEAGACDGDTHCSWPGEPRRGHLLTMRTARAHVLQQEEGVSARDPDAPCPLKLPLQLGALRLRTVYAAHLDPELRAE